MGMKTYRAPRPRLVMVAGEIVNMAAPAAEDWCCGRCRRARMDGACAMRRYEPFEGHRGDEV